MAVVTIEKQSEIALVKVNNPPVNALSHSVRAELLAAIISLDGDDAVKAVVLICEGRTFIAGADIREFGKPIEAPHLPDVITRLENATKPWIAAVHGTALGGGMEVTLGCHYRVAIASAKFGLPEVNLGLLPGAGGTVRLPRLIAAQDAVQLITSGRPISADRANELGIVNEIVASNNLQGEAIRFAKSIANNPLPASLSSRNPVDQPSSQDWEEIIAGVTKKAKGQMSPVEAALAVQQACELSSDEAYPKERERFIKLRDSQQSKALRYVFFAERQTGKIERLKNITPLAINNCGVLGGGTMGAGISAAMLLSGKSVVLVERDEASLDAGMARIYAILQASLKRKLISQSKHDDLISNLTGSTLHQAFADCDQVVEAVFEDMAVKREVFTSIEKHTSPQTILATNTSYLDVNEIAGCLKDPSRLLGLHFFSPAHIMKLVEVVAHDKVSDVTLATGFAFAKTLRKVPILSGVCDGFIANRIMTSYRKECDYMLEDGCTPRQIDSAMKQFGMPMGMFEMADMAGLDIGWATRKRLAPNRDSNERYVKIADRLCELGRFGRKTGSGWYVYEDGSRIGKDDALVQNIIEEEAAANNITRREFDDSEIMDRILSAMTAEAKALLEEGIAQRASDIDMVMILGYGFPRWRGGPMFIAGN